MSLRKPFAFGPLAMSNTVVNILNPPALATGGVIPKTDGSTTTTFNGSGAPAAYQNARIVLYHIRVVNKTAGAATFSLYIGATGGSAAGTEWWANSKTVPANDGVDWTGMRPLDTTDFLTGSASALTTLVISGEGEIGVA